MTVQQEASQHHLVLLETEALELSSSSPLNTMATAGLGVPVKLLHESLGHIITVELKTGQLYRGKLAEGTRCNRRCHFCMVSLPFWFRIADPLFSVQLRITLTSH